MKYKKGEIVLAQFPFTDGSGTKLRPVLILIEAFQVHNDYLAMFISSQVQQREQHDFVFEITHNAFILSGLIKTFVFKTTKLVTISDSSIQGLIGTLDEQIFFTIKNKLITLLK